MCFYYSYWYNPNYSTDNKSTSMPMCFGQELFGENGEKIMPIIVAISTLGC
ncbi:19943_t:CDS:1, partial [Gigaspora margarita]